MKDEDRLTWTIRSYLCLCLLDTYPVVSGVTSFRYRRHEIWFIWTRNPVWMLCLLLWKLSTLSVTAIFWEQSGLLQISRRIFPDEYIRFCLLKCCTLSVIAFFWEQSGLLKFFDSVESTNCWLCRIDDIFRRIVVDIFSTNCRRYIFDDLSLLSVDISTYITSLYRRI